MKKEKKDKNFIKKPVYPGGSKAMKKFINENLKYPPEAAQHQIEGTVSMRYTINHLGKVIDTRIISGLGYGCDEEAERVIKMLKFSVDKVRGMCVTFKKNIHVHFRKPKKTKATKQIQYTYTTTKNNPEQKQEKSGSYSYQINLK